MLLNSSSTTNNWFPHQALFLIPFVSPSAGGILFWEQNSSDSLMLLYFVMLKPFQDWRSLHFLRTLHHWQSKSTFLVCWVAASIQKSSCFFSQPDCRQIASADTVLELVPCLSVTMSDLHDEAPTELELAVRCGGARFLCSEGNKMLSAACSWSLSFFFFVRGTIWQQLITLHTNNTKLFCQLFRFFLLNNDWEEEGTNSASALPVPSLKTPYLVLLWQGYVASEQKNRQTECAKLIICWILLTTKAVQPSNRNVQKRLTLKATPRYSDKLRNAIYKAKAILTRSFPLAYSSTILKFPLLNLYQDCKLGTT